MNTSLLRGSAIAIAIGSFTILLSSCIVPGGGYGYGGGGVDIGLDYYEPYGGVYGGWGPGYRVAPFRGGDQRRDVGGGRPTHAYRPAPASHSLPSIPSHSRSGGARRH
jgi:hypothetical protein